MVPCYAFGMDILEISPDDVADKGLALENQGEFALAAHEFARASDLYAFDRKPGHAAQMTDRARTCRAAGRRRHR